MKHRNIQGIFIAILLSLFFILMVPGNNAMAYYGVSATGNYYGVTSPNGVLGGLGGLYGMYGGLYGGSSLYGGGLYGMYGGLYGGSSLYGGGLYGMYGGLYGSSGLYGMYGSLYGGLGGLRGYGLYGGGGLYGMYGGYGGLLDLGLGTLMNPFNYYSYGGMYNLLNRFDPLGDPLLGFGMLSGALF